jgi:hypothetical protein
MLAFVWVLVPSTHFLARFALRATISTLLTRKLLLVLYTLDIYLFRLEFEFFSRLRVNSGLLYAHRGYIQLKITKSS